MSRDAVLDFRMATPLPLALQQKRRENTAALLANKSFIFRILSFISMEFSELIQPIFRWFSVLYCFYDRAAENCRRPLLLCFNRSLAERLRARAKAGGYVDTWNGFCAKFLSPTRYPALARRSKNRQARLLSRQSQPLSEHGTPPGLCVVSPWNRSGRAKDRIMLGSMHDQDAA